MSEKTSTSAPAPSVKLEILKEIKLPTSVLDADLDPDGTHAMVACLDGSICEVNLETGSIRRIGTHESYASGVRSREDQIISAGYDGMVNWWDRKEGRLIRKVQAHRFWSWQMDLSPDGVRVASCSGQYLAGGIRYEPAAAGEPCIKIFSAADGRELQALDLQPPVLSVAFSPDSRLVAAANMMGTIRVWEVGTGKQLSEWNTPDFTSWGIIKSHHYVGGIFGLRFTPDGREIIACGMGPMRDPMAGNGTQTWQRFDWGAKPPKKTGEIAESDRGNGLMEHIEFAPSGSCFVMTGRLAQGKWNTALFSTATGGVMTSMDAKMRVTRGRFSKDEKRLLLCGAVGQEKIKDGRCPEFGRLKVCRIAPA